MTEQNNTSEILNNVAILIFIPIIVAVLSSWVTLWLTNRTNNKLKKEDDEKKYLNLVISTINELEFYLTKLNQLTTEAQAIILNLSSQTPVLIPTYSLYPSFLEQAKLNLSSFNKNPELVKRVGHCHFELSHIQQRLELMKAELRAKSNLPALISNVGGFKALVDSNITEFNLVISELRKELKQPLKA